MGKFKPGDLVEIVSVFYKENDHLIGTEETVTQVGCTFMSERGVHYDGIVTDVSRTGEHWLPEQLRLIRPPNDLGSWSDCIWQPKVVTV